MSCQDRILLSRSIGSEEGLKVRVSGGSRKQTMEETQVYEWREERSRASSNVFDTFLRALSASSHDGNHWALGIFLLQCTGVGGLWSLPWTLDLLATDAAQWVLHVLRQGKVVTFHIVLWYSMLTNSGSPGLSMTSPRCLFGSVSLGEKVVIAGGTDAWGSILSSAELYNSELQAWVTLPTTNRSRKMCSGGFMDKKFYVIGGMASNTEVLTRGKEYEMEKVTGVKGEVNDRVDTQGT